MSAMPAQKQRSYAEKWRKANKPAAAARARRWRKAHPGHSTPYVAASRGHGQRCCKSFGWGWDDKLGFNAVRYCRNWTRHESGLCWRHRGKEQA